MPPTSTETLGGSRIIRTEPGEKTGESAYVTENGTVWHTTRPEDYNTTGVTIERKRE